MRAGCEEQRDRERQWEGGRAGEELFSLLWSTEKQEIEGIRLVNGRGGGGRCMVKKSRLMETEKQTRASTVLTMR